MKYILAYDLGTGGTKASLFNERGESICAQFVSTDTFYPQENFREQRPEDWWKSVCLSTKELIDKAQIDSADIACLAVSGHSLGVVPIGKNKELLAEYTPIWNDARAEAEAQRFFETVDEDSWYLTTGNGFPAPLYSIFKIMWYKENKKDLYEATDKFIGTKDYINYKLTGVLATDHSYASGSGVYNLNERRYQESFIETSKIDREKLPKIYESTEILGCILPEVADKLGLSPKTQVACGGVDNACMALGAACFTNGKGYTSLGTSSWIAVSSDKPIVDTKTHSYVFAHCLPSQYVSANAIFSAGNSFRWVKNELCKDLIDISEKSGEDVYYLMDKEAQKSVLGANKLIFNPSLAGGSGLDKSDKIRGAFVGIDLSHKRSDIIRATLEGICLNLRVAMDALEESAKLSDDMLIVGGGGKSDFWRGLFADIYNKNIIESNIGEDAGSLGAAAVAAVGSGLWKDFDILNDIHRTISVKKPLDSRVKSYEKLMSVFLQVADFQSQVGEELAKINL